MEINDTLQLSSVTAPDGVTFVADDPERDHDRQPLAAAGRRSGRARGRGGDRAGRRGRRGRGRLRRRRLGRLRGRVAPWRCSAAATSGEQGERILIVGLGNPGPEHAGDRHNIGFEVADELTRRWDLGKPRKKFGGLLSEGRTGPGGPRVAILQPQTYMNGSGDSAGPARGSLKVPLDRVDRPARRDRPPLRRDPGPPRRRPGRPQRPQEPQTRLRRPRFLARPGRRGAARLDRSGDRLRLRPRPVPRAQGRGRGAGRRRRRRDGAVGRTARFRG